ncbi:hypothetical protein KJZ61_04245 [Candidatus Dependentiae bacterium]|nr:hypothetical protein [Candidatus Dependentiae bacterium]
MITTIVLMMVGLAGLWITSDHLVAYTIRLAQVLNISTLFAGFVMLSLITGLPELAIALQAIIERAPSLSTGDLIGSNLVNTSLVIGIPLLFYGPVTIGSKMFKKKASLLIGITILMATIFLKTSITRPFALLLITIYPITLIALWLTSRNNYTGEHNDIPYTAEPANVIVIKLLLITAGLFISTKLVVAQAILLAQELGTAPIYLGTTILAVGTSLPEIALNLQAFRRGDYDLAIGNAFGSVLEVGTLVLGILALASPKPITLTSIWYMAYFQAVAYGTLAIGIIGYRRLSKTTGIILVASYAAYAALEVWLHLV